MSPNIFSLILMRIKLKTTFEKGELQIASAKNIAKNIGVASTYFTECGRPEGKSFDFSVDEKHTCSDFHI